MANRQGGRGPLGTGVSSRPGRLRGDGTRVPCLVGDDSGIPWSRVEGSRTLCGVLGMGKGGSALGSVRRHTACALGSGWMVGLVWPPVRSGHMQDTDLCPRMSVAFRPGGGCYSLHAVAFERGVRCQSFIQHLRVYVMDRPPFSDPGPRLSSYCSRSPMGLGKARPSSSGTAGFLGNPSCNGSCLDHGSPKDPGLNLRIPPNVHHEDKQELGYNPGPHSPYYRHC
jgi:hypothetical protein